MPTMRPDSRRAALAAQVAQGEFDFLIPSRLAGRTVLTAREVAMMIGYHRRFIEAEAEEGLLEHFGPTNRERTRRRYTMRGVLLWIAERLDTTPDEHMRRVFRVVDRMTPAQLTELIVHATARRSRL